MNNYSPITVAYVEMAVDGYELWGCGLHTDITRASMRAIISAINSSEKIGYGHPIASCSLFISASSRSTIITVLAFNIVGDWLRDYLDPRLKEIE